MIIREMKKDCYAVVRLFSFLSSLAWTWKTEITELIHSWDSSRWVRHKTKKKEHLVYWQIFVKVIDYSD